MLGAAAPQPPGSYAYAQLVKLPLAGLLLMCGMTYQLTAGIFPALNTFNKLVSSTNLLDFWKVNVK